MRKLVERLETSTGYIRIDIVHAGSSDVAAKVNGSLDEIKVPGKPFWQGWTSDSRQLNCLPFVHTDLNSACTR